MQADEGLQAASRPGGRAQQRAVGGRADADGVQPRAGGEPVAGVDPVINPVPWIPDVLSFHSTNEIGQTQLDLAVGTFEIKVGEDVRRVTLKDRERTELVFGVE